MSTTTNLPTTDLYAVLGVQRDASAAAIKKAFRQLSLEHHPDKAGNSAEAHDKYVSIVEAYGVLKDAQKKAAYDFQYDAQQRARASYDFMYDAQMFDGDWASLLASLRRTEEQRLQELQQWHQWHQWW